MQRLSEARFDITTQCPSCPSRRENHCAELGCYYTRQAIAVEAAAFDRVDQMLKEMVHRDPWRKQAMQEAITPAENPL